MPLRALAIPILATVLGGWLGGCATAPTPAPLAAATFVVQAEDYPAAFEAAKAELADRRFELERVDARAGVILSRPRTGAGVLTPWKLRSGGRLAEDTLNAQTRTVEVRFEPAEELDTPPTGVADALASPRPPLPPGQARGSVVVSVRVLISRRVTPTRRLEPTAIRSSSASGNPKLFRRGLGTTYNAPRDLDAQAATALSRSIRRRLAD